MNFKSFILSMIGISLIGVSIGYVIGYYIQKFILNEYLFYLPVFIMAVGCVLVVYATLFIKVKK